MSGVRIVSDTNPLIYLLNGNEQIANHLDGKECWISVISELELYGKKLLTATDKREIDSLLNSCFIIDLLPGSQEVGQRTSTKFHFKIAGCYYCSDGPIPKLTIVNSR